MIKALVMSLALLQSCACHGQNDQEGPYPDGWSSEIEYGSIRGGSRRLVLFPYINGSSASYRASDVFSDVRRRALDLGYDVVLVNPPKVDASSMDGANAAEYRRHLVDFASKVVDAHGGPAQKTVFGGFSFGGLQTVVAATAVWPRLSGFFTVTSLLKPSRLPLWRHITDDSAMDATAQTSGIERIGSGLMIYNLEDVSVDWTVNRDLCSRLSRITCVEMDGTHADITTDHVDAVSEYLRALK